MVLGIIAAVVVLVLTFKLIFGNGENFWEAVKFWLKPDIFSWFDGTGFEDFISEMKLFLWLGSGVGTFFIVSGLLG